MVTITGANVEKLREQIPGMKATATEAERAKMEAEAIYVPFAKRAQAAAYRVRTAERALAHWDSGGELAWQAVAGVAKRAGYVNRGGWRVRSFSTEQMGAYCVKLHVSAARENLSDQATNEERNAVFKAENDRAVAALEREGYMATYDPSRGWGIMVRRGPELAAKMREERGITEATILEMLVKDE
jgi:hypothetical protein